MAKNTKSEYTRPEIRTYSMEELLRLIGPATAFYNIAPSDRRFKKNIQPLENPVETVNLLRGVSFNWRTDSFPGRGFRSGRDIGLIAQEVEAVLPELVVTGTTGFKGVDYAKLVAVLVEAVKDLDGEKETLREQLAELKAEHQRLLERLTRLEEAASVPTA